MTREVPRLAGPARRRQLPAARAPSPAASGPTPGSPGRPGGRRPRAAPRPRSTCWRARRPSPDVANRRRTHLTRFGARCDLAPVASAPQRRAWRPGDHECPAPASRWCTRSPPPRRRSPPPRAPTSPPPWSSSSTTWPGGAIPRRQPGPASAMAREVAPPRYRAPRRRPRGASELVAATWSPPARRARPSPSSPTARDHLAAPNRQAATALLERNGVTGPYLLAVGTIEPRENLARLVAAYERSPRLPGRWPLVVVAPPAGEASARSQAGTGSPPSGR